MTFFQDPAGVGVLLYTGLDNIFRDLEAGNMGLGNVGFGGWAEGFLHVCGE